MVYWNSVILKKTQPPQPQPFLGKSSLSLCMYSGLRICWRSAKATIFSSPSLFLHKMLWTYMTTSCLNRLPKSSAMPLWWQKLFPETVCQHPRYTDNVLWCHGWRHGWRWSGDHCICIYHIFRLLPKNHHPNSLDKIIPVVSFDGRNCLFSAYDNCYVTAMT